MLFYMEVNCIYFDEISCFDDDTGLGFVDLIPLSKV